MSETQPPTLPAVQPRAYLVPREREAHPRAWDVALPTSGLWKVTGQAGAGVSSFLVDTAVQAIAEDPRRASEGGVLLITSSKESGARMRRELADKLAATGFVADEPVVRSVHSVAFALLRQSLDADLRLISGAEQDAVIRELLLGHAEDGRGTWPTELRPALTMVGFARQLRDVLLRAIERGLTADDLRAMGSRHRIPIWTAAGDFLNEYEQVMSLTGTLRLSASELVAKVLQRELPTTWDVVLVDDAQHLAPASGELVSRLLERASLGVVGGDEEQSVFRFRGASPAFFRDLGGVLHSTIDLGASRRSPERACVIAPDAQTQRAVVVDTIRRAHFEQGVSYRDMAVIVRSTTMIEPLRRALLHAGVPVTLDPTDVVLAEQRIVVALLLGLRALSGQLTAAEWRDLMLGPVGGTDPVTLRRLLRGLRRWAPDARAEDTLLALVTSEEPLPEFGTLLTDRELAILTRIRGVLDAGRRAQAEGGSVEEILWALWAATGLADSLLAAALRGGATGSQADRDLDAAMALFDAAGDFTERRPTAGIELFIETITQQELPTGVRDRRTATPDAVSLLTAHGAAGREFSRVIVAGVQEQSWPTLGETGTMFRQEDLVDLVDAGVDPAVPVSHITERLVEERRLFHVAVTRATEQLTVTAVNDADGEEVVQPSRFIEEFCQAHDIVPLEVEALGAASYELGDTEPDAAGLGVAVRVLAKDDVLAELRSALVSDEVPGHVKRQAARQLARLSEAGVPGAAPGQWWSARDASTSERLERRERLSPSRIESLLQCPMRAVLERMVELDETVEMLYGSMAHAYLEAVGRGVDPQVARAAVVDDRRRSQPGPAWKLERDIADFDAMLGRIDDWLARSRASFEFVGAEVDVDVRAGDGVRIAGRIDRLEREASGAVHVVDLKTGATPPTKAATEDNPQLTAYQLALSRGSLVGGAVTTNRDEAPISVGGAILVYPNAQRAKLTTREQAPKSPEELGAFAEAISSLPDAMTGPKLTARTGEHCDNCRVRALCPVQPEGQVLTHG